MLTIGSNIIRGASGIIRVLGVDQVFLEQGSDARLLLTMDIYDDAGAHIAKLRKNAWAFQERGLRDHNEPGGAGR